ncbi:hypothetical protein PR048_030011 [Dryococelus australis]|uniref:Uncharacterized protein n=1 Tax=Dryococelus australis TaxID=614101 RepID=A0ABQ9GAM3_9NEOP|nr:hypothetical protein PR048_030011 [Dryococelus australis]
MHVEVIHGAVGRMKPSLVRDTIQFILWLFFQYSDVSRLNKRNLSRLLGRRNLSRLLGRRNLSRLLDRKNLSRLLVRKNLSRLLGRKNLSRLLGRKNLSRLLGRKNLSRLLGRKNLSRLLGRRNLSRLLGRKNLSRLLGRRNLSRLLGTKNLSRLLGRKNLSRLLGRKNLSRLLGRKNLSRLLGRRNLSRLLGRKNLSRLLGRKNLSRLLGRRNLSRLLGRKNLSRLLGRKNLSRLLGRKNLSRLLGRKNLSRLLGRKNLSRLLGRRNLSRLLGRKNLSRLLGRKNLSRLLVRNRGEICVDIIRVGNTTKVCGRVLSSVLSAGAASSGPNGTAILNDALSHTASVKGRFTLMFREPYPAITIPYPAITLARNCQRHTRTPLANEHLVSLASRQPYEHEIFYMMSSNSRIQTVPHESMTLRLREKCQESYNNHCSKHVVIQGATVAEWLACWPPTKAIRIQSPAGSLRIFACGNRAGRCSWSAMQLVPFPPPFHSGAAPYSPKSPSSALKTSHMARERVELSSAKDAMEITCSEYWDMEISMEASGGQAPCILRASNMRKWALLCA